MNETIDTAVRIYFYIIFALLVIDILELSIFFMLDKLRGVQIDDYESKGFSYKF